MIIKGSWVDILSQLPGVVIHSEFLVFFCSDSLKTAQMKISGYYGQEPPNFFIGNERKIEPKNPD